MDKQIVVPLSKGNSRHKYLQSSEDSLTDNLENCNFRWTDSQLISSNEKRSWWPREVDWNAADLGDTGQEHSAQQTASDWWTDQVPATASARDSVKRCEGCWAAQRSLQLRQSAWPDLSSLRTTDRRSTLVDDLTRRVRLQLQEQAPRQLPNGSWQKFHSSWSAAGVRWESKVRWNTYEKGARCAGDKFYYWKQRPGKLIETFLITI